MKKKKIKRKVKQRSVKQLKEYLENTNIYNILEDEEQDDTIVNIYEQLQNYTIKMIDLGNAESLDNKQQDEIMMRVYRPPENIMGSYYDCKADIWSIGCIAYELFTGNFLFKVSRNGDNIDRDREHLHQMYEYLGKIPRELTDNCEFKDNLFDSKGRILKHKNCEYTSIDKLLIEETT